MSVLVRLMLLSSFVSTTQGPVVQNWVSRLNPGLTQNFQANFPNAYL